MLKLGVVCLNCAIALICLKIIAVGSLCPEFSQIENADVEVTSGPPYNTGAVVKVKCDRGFFGHGSPVITCLKDGRWSGPLPYCTVSRCLRDVSKIEKNRKCRKPCKVRQDCKGQFKKCECDGWCGMSCFNPNANCSDVSSPKNGYVIGVNFLYGYSVSYGCNDGFILSGPTIRKCRSDRTWSRHKPQCLPFSACGQPGNVGDDITTGKVVGGRDAKDGAWPWQALLFYSANHDVAQIYYPDGSFGGGSVINKKWILSAAHVFDQFWSPTHENIKWENEFLIALGLTKYPKENHEIPKYVRVFEPRQVYRHDKYDRSIFDYDVALIRIGKRLKRSGKKFVVDSEKPEEIAKFSAYIRPVCLPCMDTDPFVGTLDITNNFDNKKCSESETLSLTSPESKVMVSGFGWKRHTGELKLVRPNKLQEGLVSIQSHGICLDAIRRNNALSGDDARYTDRMVCARSADKSLQTDSCSGDSGGPLVKQVYSSDQLKYWIQIAIVSWGYQCGDENPGYYTSVASVMPWIWKTIKNSERIKCPAIKFEVPAIENTKPLFQENCDNAVNARCTITCPEGHEFSLRSGESRQIIECKRNGVWSQTVEEIGSCKKMLCPTLTFEEPPIGRMKPVMLKVCQNSINSQCVVTCPKGFRFSEDGPTQKTVKCEQNGIWSRTAKEIGSCMKILCPTLTFEDPAIGRMKPVKLRVCQNAVNSQCVVTCPKGFQFSEDGSRQKTIKCDQNGIWSRTAREIGSCKKILCPNLTFEEPAIGRIKPVKLRVCQNAVNSQCIVTCPKGFQFSKDGLTRKTVRCKDNGVWSRTANEIGSCIKILCPTLTFEEPAIGRMKPVMLRVCQNAVNSQCVVTCPKDFQFSEDGSTEKTIECEQNGVWSKTAKEIGICMRDDSFSKKCDSFALMTEENTCPYDFAVSTSAVTVVIVGVRHYFRLHIELSKVISKESSQNVIEMKPLNGYALDVDSATKLNEIERYDLVGDKVILYLKKFTSNPTTLTLNMIVTSRVTSPQPATITTYEYDNPAIKCSNFYVAPDDARSKCLNDRRLSIKEKCHCTKNCFTCRTRKQQLENTACSSGINDKCEICKSAIQSKCFDMTKVACKSHYAYEITIVSKVPNDAANFGEFEARINTVYKLGGDLIAVGKVRTFTSTENCISNCRDYELSEIAPDDSVNTEIIKKERKIFVMGNAVEERMNKNGIPSYVYPLGYGDYIEGMYPAEECKAAKEKIENRKCKSNKADAKTKESCTKSRAIDQSCTNMRLLRKALISGCNQIVCPTLTFEEPAIGRMKPVMLNVCQNSVNSQCVVTCPKDFHFSDDGSKEKTVECEQNGVWSKTAKEIGSCRGDNSFSKKCDSLTEEDTCPYDFVVSTSPGLVVTLGERYDFKLNIELSKVNSKESSQYVIEMKPLSGYAINLDFLRRPNQIERYEYVDDKVIFYLKKITSNPTTLTIGMGMMSRVNLPQPATITTYEYDKPTIQCSNFYVAPDDARSKCLNDRKLSIKEKCHCTKNCFTCRTRQEQLENTACSAGINGKCGICKNAIQSECFDMEKVACKSHYAYEITVVSKVPNDAANFGKFEARIDVVYMLSNDLTVSAGKVRTFTSTENCISSCRDYELSEIGPDDSVNAEIIKEERKLFVIGNTVEEITDKNGIRRYVYQLGYGDYIERIYPAEKCKTANKKTESRKCKSNKGNVQTKETCTKSRAIDQSCTNMRLLRRALIRGCSC